MYIAPGSKVHVANMGPTWVQLAQSRPHVGLMNFAIWDASQSNKGKETNCNGFYLMNTSTLLVMVGNIFCLGHSVWLIYLYVFCEMLNAFNLWYWWTFWLNLHMQNSAWRLALALSSLNPGKNMLIPFWRHMPDCYSARSCRRSQWYLK